MIVSDTDSFASTEPLPADEQTPPIEPVAPESTGTADDDRTTREHTTDETAADREETAEDRVSASGSGDDADHPAAEGAGDVHIVSDTDAYASTEPLTASETEPAPDVTEDASDRRDAADSDRGDVADADSDVAVRRPRARRRRCRPRPGRGRRRRRRAE